MPRKLRTLPMTDLSIDLGSRNASFLREAYPGLHAAKRIAVDLGCSVELAKKMLGGAAPSRESLVRLMAQHGRAYVGFVFAPLGEWAEELAVVDRLEKAAAQANAALDEMRRLRGQA